jgi:IS30 family transposase
MIAVYTRAEVEQIRALVTQGLSYRQIAQRIGRSRASIKTIMSKTARGKPEFRAEAIAEENEKLFGALARGLLPADIARAWGWSTERVTMRLRRAGLTKLKLREIRKAMAQLDEPSIDVELRRAWDEALADARKPLTLHERAQALDEELTSLESSARAAFVISGRSSFSAARIKRIIALRQTLDLLCFLDRNQRDEILSHRLRELKEKEGSKYAPMDLGGK